MAQLVVTWEFDNEVPSTRPENLKIIEDLFCRSFTLCKNDVVALRKEEILLHVHVKGSFIHQTPTDAVSVYTYDGFGRRRHSA